MISLVFVLLVGVFKSMGWDSIPGEGEEREEEVNGPFDSAQGSFFRLAVTMPTMVMMVDGCGDGDGGGGEDGDELMMLYYPATVQDQQRLCEERQTKEVLYSSFSGKQPAQDIKPMALIDPHTLTTKTVCDTDGMYPTSSHESINILAFPAISR